MPEIAIGLAITAAMAPPPVDPGGGEAQPLQADDGATPLTADDGATALIAA